MKPYLKLALILGLLFWATGWPGLLGAIICGICAFLEPPARSRSELFVSLGGFYVGLAFMSLVQRQWLSSAIALAFWAYNLRRWRRQLELTQ